MYNDHDINSMDGAGVDDGEPVTDGGSSSWDPAGALDCEVEESETVEPHPDDQHINEVDIRFAEGEDAAVIISSGDTATQHLLEKQTREGFSRPIKSKSIHTGMAVYNIME